MCSVSALGCKVLGLVKKERIPTEQDSVAQYFTNLELPQLLSSVDYLINILPSTPDTDNILSKLVCVLLPSDRHQIPLCQSNKSVFFFSFSFREKTLINFPADECEDMRLYKQRRFPRAGGAPHQTMFTFQRSSEKL